MVDAAVLRARVEVAGVQQAQQQLRGFGTSIDQAGRTAGTASANIGRTGQIIGQSGAQAATATGRYRALGTGIAGLSPVALGATGAVGGLGLAAKAAVDSSIAWESALAGVSKTLDTTGLSASEADAAVAEMGDSIRNMALEIPIGATELAGLAEAAGALGIARENVLAFVETTATIGVTTDVSAMQAATSLGQLSNILGLTADDYERFASVLVGLGNTGASTESAILAVAERSGAAAELIGFSTDQTLAWASTIANLGIEAEAGGTLLQTFYLKTAEFVAAAGDELAILAETAGMSAAAFQQAFAQDRSAALQTFIQGLGDLDQAAQLAVLSALGFNDARITRGLLGLAGNTDNLNDSLANAKELIIENTAAAEEAGKRFETTASQIQLAKNELNESAIVMGDKLAPAFAGGLTILADGLGVLADFTTEVEKSVEAVEDLSGAQDESQGTHRTTQQGFRELGATFRLVSGNSDDLTGDLNLLWSGFLLGHQVLSDSEQAMREYEQATEDERAALDRLIARVAETTALFVQAEPPISATAEGIDAAQLASERYTLQVDLLAESQRESMLATLEAANANEIAGQAYDEAAVHASMLASAQGILASAYQTALDVQGAFTSQSGEYAASQQAVEEAVAAVQEKQAAGIPLSQKEIDLLATHEDVLGRFVGGQQDATIEAGLAALAAGELMQAQDELNAAIERGDEDLGPYKQAVEDAQTALGNMGSATGETQDAQGELVDTIQGPLITAIGDLTRAVEYIAKPWLVQIDAATEAAAEEVQRLKDMISSGAILPVSIVSGTTSGPTPFAEGGIYTDGVALVGERGPELAVFPRGTAIVSNHALPFLGGFADGTGAVGGSASAGGTFNTGAVLAREFMAGFEAGFDESWITMWTSAFDDVQRLFTGGNIADLMTGDVAERLQAEILAMEAILGSLEEIGFGPGTQIYDEAYADYKQLLKDFEVAAAIAGTDSAQAYWEEWKRNQPRVAGPAIIDISELPEWAQAGHASAIKFSDGFWEAVVEDGVPEAEDAGDSLGNAFAGAFGEAVEFGVDQTLEDIVNDALDAKDAIGNAPEEPAPTDTGGGGGGGGVGSIVDGNVISLWEVGAGGGGGGGGLSGGVGLLAGSVSVPAGFSGNLYEESLLQNPHTRRAQQDRQPINIHVTMPVMLDGREIGRHTVAATLDELDRLLRTKM